eukprot:CAMPEP_0202893732 /NCGR_PEP_ID=MMETSP1392-20130828/3259_1 /ASSEMBLY_ACC=CAM_ASM_000868 /TAXON_ID=225041 /ORGANISM="Chlamydomonas chlamydogama, Strain SAG 11-48b" /LENGTH=275 /DNA_ID=CAMNT_0049578173 /DNA_START=93 /DNA_END=920 /DNA_ORIENTATION=-
MSDDERRPDRPVFCGNFEYDAEEKEVFRLFDKYGPVDRIDMKQGFAFVYMKNKRDAEDSIRKLDGLEFGYKRRRLKVQWAKQAESERKRECKPSTTLFIVNFDTARTRERDIERYFDYYGSIKRVEIKKNYAFVQFDSIDDAIKALEATNGRKLSGRTITVEYTQNEDPFAARDKDRGGRGGASAGAPHAGADLQAMTVAEGLGAAARSGAGPQIGVVAPAPPAAAGRQTGVAVRAPPVAAGLQAGAVAPARPVEADPLAAHTPDERKAEDGAKE